MSESPQSAPESQHLSTPIDRLATWAQFPRRVILLLVAYGFVSLLLTGLLKPLLAGASASSQSQNWELSWQFNKPVVELIATRTSNTILLLGTAFSLALLLAIVATFAGVLVHRLEQASGALGAVLKGLGRMGCLVPATMPVAVLALFLISYFAVQHKLLPVGGSMSPQAEGSLSDAIQHLILPASTLALLPGVLVAQAMARETTLFQVPPSARVWLARLFKLLGLLLGQVGGWLTASIVVETVFSWPGLGKLAFDATVARDYPTLLGVLGTFAGIILWGRLAAELFHWLGSLVHLRVPTISPQAKPSLRSKTTHRVWVVFALFILIIPLGFVVAGLGVDSAKASHMNVQTRNAPPSADHPWGTDSLGRDLQARTLRGGLTTLGVTALAVVIVLIPALAGGALTGFLASRGKFWADSLADLLLLPADAMMFIPALAGLMVFMVIGPAEGGGWLWLALGAAAVIIPRAMRAYQSFWTAAPETRKWLVLGLFGSGALLLGVLFAGFGLIMAMDFLGLGIQPPQPTLGGILADQRSFLALQHTGLFAAGCTLWVCAAAFYLSADALAGFFYSKEPLARLNE